jgi:branched-chain amino acid transport system ATP-binding protein
MVFGVLRELQREQGKTIVMVEQNARKGLEFADVGYVLVAGRVVMAARSAELLDHPQVGQMFLGA